nr:hypothetical protein [Tanacetum cinerariifolium]
MSNSRNKTGTHSSGSGSVLCGSGSILDSDPRQVRDKWYQEPGRFEAMANETEKNGASGSVVDENQGRDDARQHPKKRGTSKNVVASLDKRVASVETSMAELKNQVEGLEGLGSDFESMREDFRVAFNTLSDDLKREIHDLRYSFMGEIAKIREEFGEEVSTLHKTIEDLQADVALCKRSLASGGGNANMDQSWMFLNHHRSWESGKIGRLMISYGRWENTWKVGFVADFKKQFYPENAKNEAKSRLRKLKQFETIREYVKEFTTLVLEIPELSDQYSLFYFLDGLQGWAKTELEWHRVQDLATVIAHVEALIDFSSRRASSKPRDRKVNHEKGGGDKNAQPKVDHARKPPIEKDRSVKMNYKSGGCFICDGPHRARDCPKKISLNGMSAHEDEDASNDGSMGSMRILNAIKAKMEVPKVIGKGLQYVEATINGVKKQKEKRIEEEQAANARYWKILACCDDDDDYDFEITPILSTKEPIDSLSMWDEHLDTISATESDEVIKSSVENLVLIPSEFEGIPDTMCDVHFDSNQTPLEAKDHLEIVLNSNDDIFSSDDDSLHKENIEYVEASPHDSELVSLEAAEIVILEVEEIEDDNLREKLLNEETSTFHNSLPKFENFYFDLGEISSGSTTTHSDISLSEYDSFIFEEFVDELAHIISPPEYDRFYFRDLPDQGESMSVLNSGIRKNLSTTLEFVDELAHIISPPEYDCFYFKDLPNPGELMSVLNSGVRENLSTTLVNLPIEDDHSPLLAYVVWIFVAYLTYSVIPPYLHPFGNEDTIFDPCITINHFYSFEPGLSHRHGAFKKFNTHCSHLNEWPMIINGKNTP